MDRLLWTQVSDMGPAPRFPQAMSYESDRGRVVMCGGRVTAPTLLLRADEVIR